MTQDRLKALRKPDRAIHRNSARYSQFIRVMRLALPIVVVAIVVAVIGWLYVLNDPPVIQADTVRGLVKNELESPHFQSVDEQNQPFSIWADQAIQDEHEENLIALVVPQAEVALSTGQNLQIKAQNGLYHQAQKILSLNENVEFFDQENHTVKTSKLTVDLNKSQAVSNVFVRGDGPEGYIEGAGMILDSRRDLLIVHGPAKAVLYQSDLESSLSF